MTVARRTSGFVLCVVLFTSACTATGSVDVVSTVTSLEGAAQTSSQSDSTSANPTPTTATGAEGATTTTRDPGAAGTADLDYLVLGPGSRFVPLDNPVMIPASEVTWLAEDSIVLGVVHPSGEVHAFPADMMAYHHVANTTIAGEPYLVTY